MLSGSYEDVTAINKIKIIRTVLQKPKSQSKRGWDQRVLNLTTYILTGVFKFMCL